MSLLPSATFANPSTPFYAANGGGGGGSSLTSPATITPDATGNVSLALNAITTPGSTPTSGATVSVVNNVTGGGGAAVIVSDTTGNDAALQLLNTAGGNSLILMGTAAAPVGIIAPSLTAAGQIQMGVVNVPAGSIPTPVVKIDAANNIVDIANPLAAASVFLNGQTFVTSSASRPPTNALVLSNSSPTASAITQQVASGGTLQLGSSVAKPNVLTVSDIAGSASVTVGANGAGASDIQLTGGITGGAANITTTAGGTGQLSLGASSVNPQTLFIRDGATANSGYVEITGGTAGTSALQLRGFQTGGIPTISTNLNTGVATSLAITPGTNDATPAMVLSNDGAGNINIAVNQQMNISKLPASAGAYTSQVLLPAGTAYSGSLSIDLTALPSGWAMVYGFSAAPTATDKNNMFSVMVFTGPTNVLQGGGVGGLAGSATCFPDPANNTSLQVNFAGATSTGYSILGITLLGG